MAGVVGFEPTHADTKNRCLTAWLYPSNDNIVNKLEWCRNTDSNRGPDDYKSTALPTELLRHIKSIYALSLIDKTCPFSKSKFI